ncbi:MAG: hypothetical protein ACLR43_13575 [Faecalibacillus faecis]
MSQIKLIPTKLKGKVSVPPSKSLAHRAIIAASLAKGISRIDHIEYSQDIKATIGAMEALEQLLNNMKIILLLTVITHLLKIIRCQESKLIVKNQDQLFASWFLFLL